MMIGCFLFSADLIFFLFHRITEELESIAFGTKISSLAVQNNSVYFEGDSFLQLPIDLNPVKFPTLTIGFWIQPVDLNMGPLRLPPDFFYIDCC
jgi:hypothetical protein